MVPENELEPLRFPTYSRGPLFFFYFDFNKVSIMVPENELEPLRFPTYFRGPFFFL